MLDTYNIITNPVPEDIQFLDNQLIKHNYEQTGILDYVQLAIFLRNDVGQIMAGIYGWTWGGCCEIIYLWIHPDLRGKGWGTRLLLAAESEALSRECRQIILETHNMQAARFFQKFNFEVFAEIEDYPRGYKKTFLKKCLRYSNRMSNIEMPVYSIEEGK